MSAPPPFAESLDALDAYVADPSQENRERLRLAMAQDALRVARRYLRDVEIIG